METFDRITRGQIALKYPEWLLLADHTLAAARLFFPVLGPVKPDKLDEVKRAILFMHVRSFRAAEACFRLFSDGFAPEAYLPLRTLFEHLVDMRFLSSRPDEAARFWKYMPVGIMRHVRASKRYLKTSPFSPEFVRGVEEAYSLVKGDFANELRWSTLNIADRAAAVGLEEQYNFIYRMCSEYCHTGPLTFPKHFIEDETYLNVPLGPALAEQPTVLGILIPVLLQVCEVVDASFELGQLKLLESLSLEFGRLTGTAPGEGESTSLGRDPSPNAEQRAAGPGESTEN
jgi:hypothetical protein